MVICIEAQFPIRQVAGTAGFGNSSEIFFYEAILITQSPAVQPEAPTDPIKERFKNHMQFTDCELTPITLLAQMLLLSTSSAIAITNIENMNIANVNTQNNFLVGSP